MKKILFFVAAAVMMTVGCTKENPAPAGTDSQTPSGQEGEGKEDEKPEKTLTGYRAAYTYYVADEALDLSVVGAPKKLVAVYSDNSTAAVSDASAFTFSNNAQIAASEGDQTFSATYKGETVSVTIPVKKGSEGFGATSLTTTEWAWGSENIVGFLEAGQSATLKMFVYSSCKDNYFSPCVQLCNADWSSNFISVRMDNYGWDSSWDACTKDNNWNWGEGDTFPGFRPYQNHNLVTITVTRNTATTATIRYDAKYWNGETHFQSYSNIAVSDMVNYRFFTENSYAVVYEVQKPEEGQQGGGDDPQPQPGDKTLTGYACAYNYYVADEALSLDVVGYPKKLVAVYSDNSTAAVDASAFTFSAGQQIAASEGDQTVSATYKGETVSVTIPVKKGSEGFGATSLDGAWTFASENTVGQLEVGQSATLKMFVYSAGQNNYSAPIAELVSADWNNVYADFRMDHFGWLNADFENQKLADSYKSSNWDWNTFAASQNHALINITVSHPTATTATVRYDVIYWNGESHFQEYTSVPVGGTPVNYRFATESSYAVVLK